MNPERYSERQAAKAIRPNCEYESDNGVQRKVEELEINIGDVVDGKLIKEDNNSKDDEGGSSDADSEHEDFEPRQGESGAQDLPRGCAEDKDRDDLQAKPPIVAGTPVAPTQAELDVHNCMGHAVYRQWCEACITGQGREDQH